jgi:hypothetical protein
LHADLKEDVYTQQMPGFIDDPQEVLKLKKSWYGLRSSAKNFFVTISKCLIEFGLKQSYSDECLFSNENPDIDELFMLVLHVDDIAAATKKLGNMKRFIDHLKEAFEVKENGKLSEYLGLNFEYHREQRELKISQSSYIKQKLEQFGMQDCKNVKTPIGSDVKIMIDRDHNETISANEVEQYSEMVGVLAYLANASRPDVSFVAAVLCRYIGKPARVHIETAKRTMRYLKSTIETYTVYSDKGKTQPIIVYSDADHANYSTCESISGVCTLVYGNLVGWSSYKQNRVATATCESEVLSVLDGVNEIEFIKNLLNELRINHHTPILFNDNQGCLKSTETGGQFKSNKHYRIRLNRIRRAIADGLCEVKYCQTRMMIADAMTKKLAFDSTKDLFEIAGHMINRSI